MIGKIWRILNPDEALPPASTESNGEDAQVETHYEDCFACRMTGSLSFAALSGYSFVQYRKVLPGATLSHRVLLLGMTGAFAGAGVFRWLV